ncbi:Abi-like protein [Rubripirellula lacrimiformis]|uniref:Abi-like protein n=1 Tax=Rubripirellula lacrimiformis TaxID=1930273 RepID=A0A517NAH7_9BACT|nr:Abi family protein [Rubripirellula lacrimiformis]QDT04135.1 Abi-like protein [Rubripirellula lacrimiformis]
MTKSYDKDWLSIDDQMALLESRGLVIDDKPDCKEFLNHLGYYRHSGYALAFEPNRHTFYEGTTYRDIDNAYRFDVHRRDIIADALEVIEVDFRITVAHFFAQPVGEFGHLNRTNFQQPRGYSNRL